MDPTVALPCVDGADPTLASWSLSTTVVINGGDGGMEPTAPIIVIDHGDGSHFRLQRRSIAAVAMAVFVDDGRH